MCPITKIKCPEKRRYIRHNCEAGIRWSHFNKAIFFDAILLNFSESGVYFETAHGLTPGATIFLDMRMVAGDKIKCTDHMRPRLVSLGDVKWCIDLAGEIRFYFGVGASYPFLD